MKIHIQRSANQVLVYPFLAKDAPYRDMPGKSCFVVRPDGIKLVWVDTPVMSIEAARKLASALLEAITIYDDGVK